MKTSLGNHFLIDFYDCNYKKIISVNDIKQIMIKSGKMGEFHVVKKFFHQFKPYGVSGVLVLKESHFTIHTWPEYNYVAVDIFLCNFEIDITMIIKYLSFVFESKNYKIKQITRGVLK